MLRGAGGAQSPAALRELCLQYGIAPPGEGQSHFFGDFGRFRLKWERHGEFDDYTVYRNLIRADDPFAEPAIDALPSGWLGQIEGLLVSAVHIALVPDGPSWAHRDRIAAALGASDLIGAQITDGSAAVYTDLHLDAHGYTRSHIGVLGSLDALGAITLNMVLGQVASRRGTTMALVLGAGLTVLGHVALLEASWWPVGAMAYLLRSGAGTFHWIGTGAVGAILRGLPGSSNGRTERGFALYYMAEGAVLAISTMLAGLIYGWWSPGPFIVSMASLSLLVAIALVARSGWWTGRYPSGRERPSEMARIGDIR
ncbi:MAG: DUF3422 family protein [Chloroflexi bacterium]|nr:DUF3422 family protein [Chloroflexota bacterium]